VNRLELRKRTFGRGVFGEAAAGIYRRLCAAGFALENESRIIDVLRSKQPAGNPGRE